MAPFGRVRSFLSLPVRNVKATFSAVLLMFATLEIVSHGSIFETAVHEKPLIKSSTLPSTFITQNHQRSISRKKPFCERDKLVGLLNVTFEAPSFDEIAKLNADLQPGGVFEPRTCQSEHDRIAVVIPFRNRTNHLRAILHHLHPILQRQRLNYAVFVVEQTDDDVFNKAVLMNIGFVEALKQSQLKSDDYRNQFNCFIFHDVDLFLEDDRGVYGCRDRPLHISEYIDKFNYEKWGGADVLFGGVVSLKRRIFELVNGYSTVFFGWGGEDEEMRVRLKLYKVPIEIPPKDYYRFKMAKHELDSGNPWNANGPKIIRQTGERMQFDGLNSLSYNLLQLDLYQTHTRLLVNFSRAEIYKLVYGSENENLNKFGSLW